MNSSREESSTRVGDGLRNIRKERSHVGRRFEIAFGIARQQTSGSGQSAMMPQRRERIRQLPLVRRGIVHAVGRQQRQLQSRGDLDRDPVSIFLVAMKMPLAQSSADKVMVIVPPIAAFVAAGFEHSVANLYFLPYALAIKTWGGPEFWAAINQTAASYPELTVGSVFHNILVATVGNLVGGSLMVGAVYWFVYLRRGTRSKV